MRNLLAYCTGWLVTLSWCTFLAGGAIVIGNTTKYCILVYNPGSTWANSQWLPTLLAMIDLIGCGLFKVGLAKKFPILESIMIIIQLASWTGVVVTLWVCSKLFSVDCYSC
jgi:hypothetical protein